MVVAAGTGHSQPQKDIAGDIRHLVQDVVPMAASVALVVFEDSQAKVTGRDHRVGSMAGELVTGQLLGYEFGIGFVCIERANDVVAISPEVSAVGILIPSIRLGVPYHVQPVPPPVFSIARIFQQRVDLSLPGIGRFVAHECL